MSTSENTSLEPVLNGRGLLIIAVLALLPYVFLPPKPLFGDAVFAVSDNQAVQERPLSELLVLDFWGKPLGESYATGSYRPLVSLTYAVQIRVFGAGPRGLHLFDMGLHAVMAMLVALLLQHLIPASRWAVYLGVLFAVHPLASEAVSSLVGRADLMAGVFLVAAILAHLRAIDSARFLLFEALTVVFVASALFCKEYAVVFPFLIIAADLAMHSAGRVPVGRRRRQVVVWVILLVWLGGYFAIRYALMGHFVRGPSLHVGDNPLVEAGLASRWGTSLAMFLTALRLLVLPFGLNHIYGSGTLPVLPHLLAPKAILAFGVVAALVALSVRALLSHRRPVPIIACTFFILPLLPSLGFVTLSGVLFAERHLYLPMVGLILAIGWALRSLPAGPRAQLWVKTAFIGVSVVFLFATWSRVDLWKSNAALARASLEAYPHSARAWYQIGLDLGARNDPEGAADAFRRALDVEPMRARTWRNYAIALGKAGRAAESVEAWRRCVELAPEAAGPLLRGLGEALLNAGRIEEAVRSLAQAHGQSPEDERSGRLLGKAFLRLGQIRLMEKNPGAAIQLAGQAVALGSLPPEGYFLAGQIVVRAGNREKAQELFDHALRLDPDLLRKKHQVAIEHTQAGRYADAAELFHEIVLADPHKSSAWFNLGRSYLLMKRYALAIDALENGLQVQEDPGARALLRQARRGLSGVPD